jgi:TonB family protein
MLRFARQSRPALAVIGNARPRYPVQLRGLGIEGGVLVSFQVTSDGRVREGSLRVLKSSDAAFATAVLDVLPTYRFEPAMIDCEPVPQWVQQPFAFLLGRRPSTGDSLPP